MVIRWNVYRHNRLLGLMTAAEIRSALARGAIDPFDYVSREGSNVRLEIVEVDEIFNQGSQLDSSPNYANQTRINTNIQENYRPPDYHRQEDGFLHQNLTQIDRQAELQAKPYDLRPTMQPRLLKAHASPRPEKRYYLLGKNRNRLGPLSPSEIQSLFARGIVGRKALVQKIGDPKTIKITDFISKYSTMRLNELSGKAEHQFGRKEPSTRRMGGHRMQPSSAVLNELYHGVLAQKLAKKKYYYLGIVFIGVIMGLGVFSIKKHLNISSKRQKILRVEKTHTPGTSRYSKHSTRSSSKKSLGRAKSPSKAAKALNRNLNKNKKRINIKRKSGHSTFLKPQRLKGRPSSRYSTRLRQTQPSLKRSIYPKRQKISPQFKSRATTPSPLKTPPIIPKELSPRPQSQPVAPKSPPKSVVVPKKSSKPRMTSTRSLGGGVNGGALAQNVGKQITTVPLRFNLNDLNNCPIKCQITFRFPSGEAIKGVFFKGAFLDPLIRSRGRARIVGTLKKSGAGYTIFVQGVR